MFLTHNFDFCVLSGGSYVLISAIDAEIIDETL